MRYRRAATAMAFGLAAVMGAQLWMLLDGPIHGANMGAGLLSLLGTLVLIAGGVVLIVVHTGRHY